MEIVSELMNVVLMFLGSFYLIISIFESGIERLNSLVMAAIMFSVAGL